MDVISYDGRKAFLIRIPKGVNIAASIFYELMFRSKILYLGLKNYPEQSYLFQ